MTDPIPTKKLTASPLSRLPNELTGAPKARIVSFPTRQQATGRSFSFGYYL
jgi:hypothetical protein